MLSFKIHIAVTAQRWVRAYQQDRLLISCNTSNGVEHQNESFKYSYMQRYRNFSLTGMWTNLVEEFLDDKLEKRAFYL